MAKNATATATPDQDAPGSIPVDKSEAVKKKSVSSATKAKAAAKTASKAATKTASEAATKTAKAATKTESVTAAKTAGTKTIDKKATVLLTLTDIGDHLAATFDMPKSHARIYLAEAVALIAKNLRKGHKVRIAGLGVFEVKRRAARRGRNPGSGEPIKIKATKRVGFAVARNLKAKL